MPSTVAKWPEGCAFVFGPAVLPDTLNSLDIEQLMSSSVLEISSSLVTNAAGDAAKSLTEAKGKLARTNAVDSSPILHLGGSLYISRDFVNWVKNQFMKDSQLVGELVASLIAPTEGPRCITVSTRGGVDTASLIAKMLYVTKQLESSSTAVAWLETDSAAPVDIVIQTDIEVRLGTGLSSTADADMEETYFSRPEDYSALARAKEEWDKLVKSHGPRAGVEHIDIVLSPFYSHQRIRSLFAGFSKDFTVKGCVAGADKCVEQVWALLQSSCVESYVHEANNVIDRLHKVK